MVLTWPVTTGHLYGTPRPAADPAASRPPAVSTGSDALLAGRHPSSDGKRRRNRSTVEAMAASTGDQQPPPPENGHHRGTGTVAAVSGRADG